MKNKRQTKIINILKNQQVHTHDELIDALDAEGVKVTQATVSRDIKELGIVKVPASDGSSIYSVPETASESHKNRVNMVSDSVKCVNSAMHTIVINTFPGMASAVAAAIDSMSCNEILGSVAGDDAIIVITKSPELAKEVEKKIKAAFRMV